MESRKPTFTDETLNNRT